MFLDEFPHMQASSAAASASTAKEKVPRSQQGNLWGASGVFLQFFLQNMDGLNKIKPFTATVNNMEKHDWTNTICDLSHGDQQYVTACPTTRTANLLLVMAKTKWPWHMGIHFWDAPLASHNQAMVYAFLWWPLWKTIIFRQIYFLCSFVASLSSLVLMPKCAVEQVAYQFFRQIHIYIPVISTHQTYPIRCNRLSYPHISIGTTSPSFLVWDHQPIVGGKSHVFNGWNPSLYLVGGFNPLEKY